jgi:hypothetical protein
MTSPNQPYVQIDLILPVGHDIMLVSNDEECFKHALNMIRSNLNHLKSDILTEVRNNWTSYEKFKAWIDVKSGTNTKELIPQLVEAVQSDLLSRNLVCEVRMTLG